MIFNVCQNSIKAYNDRFAKKHRKENIAQKEAIFKNDKFWKCVAQNKMGGHNPGNILEYT